jgi:2-amino-4-hydroxy-6-hydroxymethyldihydropteridine diphosphokinase
VRQESNKQKASQLALIALGSNESSTWGDAKETVQKAMLELAVLSSERAEFSGFFATPAFPAGAGPDYVNAAMAIYTTVCAADLLDQLHVIEAAAGRTRGKRWGQRTLDLDLIAVGDATLPDENTHKRWRDLPLADQQVETPSELILPHPRLQDRAFVLVPLMEVAPDWQHPILGLSVAQMCAALPDGLRAEVARLSDPHSP